MITHLNSEKNSISAGVTLTSAHSPTIKFVLPLDGVIVSSREDGCNFPIAVIKS